MGGRTTEKGADTKEEDMVAVVAGMAKLVVILVAGMMAAATVMTAAVMVILGVGMVIQMAAGEK